MPPIDHLQRLPALQLELLEHHGIFTTGLLLERSETPTRRQTLADQVSATTNDVRAWRDEALLLNLASFGPPEQALFSAAGVIGLADLLAVDLETFTDRVRVAAGAVGQPVPTDQRIEGWWEQARTLDDD